MSASRIVFPTQSEISADVKVDTTSYNKTYLIDGEVLRWSGEGQTITSAVCVRGEEGGVNAGGGWGGCAVGYGDGVDGVGGGEAGVGWGARRVAKG